jgi:hypothetical protein
MSCSNFQVSPQHGGTGVDGSSAPNGSLLIGNGAGYTLGTVTGGSGVTVTNGAGTITIAATGSGGTVTSVNLTAPAAGITVSGGPITTSGSITLALADDLSALEGLSGTGLAARTGTSTWAVRTLTGPAAGITVTNGDGVSGNPTLALANDLSALEALSGTNTIYYRSGADTWTAVTVGTGLSFSGGTLSNTVTGTVTSVNLTAPAAGITVSGGPITTSGSITLALADDLAALEALSGTNTIYYRSAANTWTAVTIGSNLTFSGGTLSATGGGSGVTSITAGTGLTGGTITTTGTIAVATTIPQAQTIKLTDAGTSGIATVLTVSRSSSGTPGATFGPVISIQAKSSTTDDRDMVRLKSVWNTATDASRAAGASLTAYFTTTERTCITWGADSTGPLFGVLGAAASAALANPDLGTLATTFGFATGVPTFNAANLNGTGIASTLAATQTELEAGTSLTKYTSPGNQQYHPSAAKGWVRFNGTGTVAIAASYNVSSITDNGVGDWTVNWTTAFSSANYGVCINAVTDGSTYTDLICIDGGHVPTASALRIRSQNIGTGLRDEPIVCVSAFGDQ